MNLPVFRTLLRLALLTSSATLAAGVVAQAAAVQDAGAAWVGTWKLDRSQSHLAGDTFTYSMSKKGFLHYDEGGPIHYDFAIDGKEYPTIGNRTTSWNAVGDHAWDSVGKANGAVWIKIHRELSGDDHTLTITATGTKPDGSTFNERSVYTRVSGSKGLLGTWRSTQSDSGPPDTYVVSEPAPGVMRWTLPDWQYTVEGKMDGKNMTVTGPRAVPGMTYSGTLPGPGKIAYSIKLNSEPITVGVETIAADGKSFADVSYTPGKEDEKITAVYVKQ